MHPSQKFLAIGLVILAFGGGTVFMSLAFDGGRGRPQHATVLPQAAVLPDFSLVDHAGAPFNRHSLLGRWSLVFFGFTNCPDVCPATLTQLAAARKRLRDAGNDAFPDIILISVDPERDAPEVMAAYVQKFGDGITGVTGSLEEIRKLASSLGIYFHSSVSAGGHHDVEHSAAVMLINKSAELEALFGAPYQIDSFVTDIPLLTGSR